MCCGASQRVSTPKSFATTNYRPPTPTQRAMSVPMLRRITPQTQTKKCSCGWPMCRIARKQNGKLVFYLVCMNKGCKKQEPA